MVRDTVGWPTSQQAVKSQAHVSWSAASWRTMARRVGSARAARSRMSGSRVVVLGACHGRHHIGEHSILTSIDTVAILISIDTATHGGPTRCTTARSSWMMSGGTRDETNDDRRMREHHVGPPRGRGHARALEGPATPTCAASWHDGPRATDAGRPADPRLLRRLTDCDHGRTRPMTTERADHRGRPRPLRGGRPRRPRPSTRPVRAPRRLLRARRRRRLRRDPV